MFNRASTTMARVLILTLCICSGLGFGRTVCREGGPQPERAVASLSPQVHGGVTSLLRTGALAVTTLDLVGLELRLPAEPMNLPRNAPFFVPVTLGLQGASVGQAPNPYPADAMLQGTLTGPGLAAPVSLSGTLASGLSVPGLPEAGDYTVSGVQLIHDSRVLLKAQQEAFSIHCLGDVLVTSVSASPMTLDEIKQAGIQLEPGDYTGRRFEMTLSVGGKQVSLDIPIAIPVYNGLEDPRGSVGPAGLKIGNIQGAIPNGLSVVLAAIEPEIGHMKGDGLLGRNFLKGMAGDAINALLCGAGHNLRKILARLRALLCLLTDEARATLGNLLDRIGLLSDPQPAPITA